MVINCKHGKILADSTTSPRDLMSNVVTQVLHVCHIITGKGIHCLDDQQTHV